jgi:hypothetical protein
MRCFYHEDKEAVGTCKSCGKGLCRECAVDLTKGLACRGHCEADAQAVIQLIDRNIQLMPSISLAQRRLDRTRQSSGFFHVAFGVIFIAVGFSSEQWRLFVILGMILIGYGIYRLAAKNFLGVEIKK